MKHAPLIALVAATLLTAPAFAQDIKNGQPTSQQGVTPPETGPSSGTKPGSMGSTGWTGGRRDSHSGAGPETTGSSPNNINNESEYSTGTDLKGPPIKFPANKTPE
jgi:hypothetical protein